MDLSRERFCVLPWVHLYVEPSGDVLGCSKWGAETMFGHTSRNSLEELWKSDAAERNREAMLAGGPPKACRYCNELEASGVSPYWKRENENYPEAFRAREWTRGPTPVGGARPTFIEFRFSNLCNLKCRTCGPRLSSAWYAEAPEIYGEKWGPKPTVAFEDRATLEKFVKDAAPDLKTVQLLGGEPLIQDETYILLEKLLEAGKSDVHVKITTNFTRLKHRGWDFVELARKFKRVTLSISLDGIGKQSEYLRKGSRWAEIEENFRKLRSTPEIEVNLYPCISALNAFHLVDAIDGWIESGILTPSSPMFTNFVTAEPLYYNIRILNAEERAQLSLRYVDYLMSLKSRAAPAVFLNVSNYFRDVMRFLEGGSLPEQRSEFARASRALDRLRKESLPELFPELTALYES